MIQSPICIRAVQTDRNRQMHPCWKRCCVSASVSHRRAAVFANTCAAAPSEMRAARGRRCCSCFAFEAVIGCGTSSRCSAVCGGCCCSVCSRYYLLRGPQGDCSDCWYGVAPVLLLLGLFAGVPAWVGIVPLLLGRYTARASALSKTPCTVRWYQQL